MLYTDNLLKYLPEDSVETDYALSGAGLYTKAQLEAALGKVHWLGTPDGAKRDQWARLLFFGTGADGTKITATVYLGWRVFNTDVYYVQPVTVLIATLGAKLGDGAVVPAASRLADVIANTDDDFGTHVASWTGKGVTVYSPDDDTIAEVIVGDCGGAALLGIDFDLDANATAASSGNALIESGT